MLNSTKTTWDFSSLYSSDTDAKIESDKEKVKEENYKFINKWKDREDYLSNPKVLKEALDEYEKLARNYGSEGNFGYYFWLRSSQDQNNSTIKAQNNKINDFSTKISNDIQFFEHRLAKVSAKKQNEFLNSKELKLYKHYLESLFKISKYLLSEDEEKILRLKSPVSYGNWVKMLSALLSKEEREVLNDEGKKEVKNFSEILGLINNKNKSVRDTAAEALNDIFLKWIDVGENEFNSVLQNIKIDRELRGYKRPDESRHIGDDIETEVVDSLVEAVSSRYALSKKYYELKAKLFKVKKLEYHERNVEYGEVNKKYTYQESVDLVYKVLNNLDSEFGEIFKDFVESGKIDAFPKKGKQTGAFCAHHLMSQPTFILLNHTDLLNDVLTIAHETGHGIHNELQKPHVHALDFGTSLATAEVASTFMEDFVLQEILNEADDELKLSILMQKLNDDISTIQRQIAFYKFEWDIHNQFKEKGYLSKDEIGNLFTTHMQSYMGDFVDHPETSKNWWLYVNHFRSPFYVYSYSSGLIISKALQNMVKEDSKNVEKVKQFLQAGENDTPKNIFAKIDIDIADKNFWNKGLDEIQALLTETEDLATKLGKM